MAKRKLSSINKTQKYKIKISKRKTKASELEDLISRLNKDGTYEDKTYKLKKAAKRALKAAGLIGLGALGLYGYQNRDKIKKKSNEYYAKGKEYYNRGKEKVKGIIHKSK